MIDSGLDDSTLSSTASLARQIAVAALSRTLLNTARRFVYPFAPIFSRELGVPLTAVTSMIAVNQITGLVGLVFGPLADRLGYRIMMLAGMALLAVGMVAGGLIPVYGIILPALFLAGLGKSMFDPALQAYVGRRVPYHRRGLMIGIIELSWSGSSLVGIPLVGLLIERLGWRSPFFTLGGLALLAIAALMLVIPREQQISPASTATARTLADWQLLLRYRPALAVLGFGFFTAAANDTLFVVYGAWLQQSFGLRAMALGLATTVIGGAELLGETLTVSIADRLGLRRSVLGGLVFSALGYAMLPLLGQSLPSALLGLFLIFLAVEFSIVTLISYATEVLPSARATMMAGYLAASSMGRIGGAFLGGPVWLAGGIGATAVATALLSVVAIGLLSWGYSPVKTRTKM